MPPPFLPLVMRVRLVNFKRTCVGEVRRNAMSVYWRPGLLKRHPVVFIPSWTTFYRIHLHIKHAFFFFLKNRCKFGFIARGTISSEIYWIAEMGLQIGEGMQHRNNARTKSSLTNNLTTEMFASEKDSTLR